MKLNILAGLIGLVLLNACDPHSEQHSNNTDNAEVNAVHSVAGQPDHQQSLDHLSVALNGEERWIMDQHTRELFLQMEKRMNETAEDQLLAVALSTDLKELINGCTMTGEAHDQLHVYLMSLMPAIHQYEKTPQRMHREEVQQILSQYPKFFQ